MRALRAWARVELAMPADEFDQLSPADAADMWDAWEARERRTDMRFGVLAAITANAHRDTEKTATPFEPADFFPSLGDGAEPMTPDQVFDSAVLAFGGEADQE